MERDTSNIQQQIDSVEQEISDVEQKITGVGEKISVVEQEISVVQQKINCVERKIDKTSDELLRPTPGDEYYYLLRNKGHLEKDEEYFGVKRALLFGKKEQLRTKKEQLRTKKGLLLQEEEQLRRRKDKKERLRRTEDEKERLEQTGKRSSLLGQKRPYDLVAGFGVVDAGYGVDDELTSLLCSLTNAQVRDDCLVTPDNRLPPVPRSHNFSKLFIRKFYRDAFDTFLERVQLPSTPGVPACFGITGAPGVGKSTFFAYMLYRFVTITNSSSPWKPEKIIYQMDGERYFLFDVAQRRRVVTKIPRIHWIGLNNSANTLYVIDGDTSIPAPSLCVTMYISSPRSDTFKHFVQQRMPVEICFPEWTIEEIEKCQRSCYPLVATDDIKRRYEVYGGVPRYVFVEPPDIFVGASLRNG